MASQHRKLRISLFKASNGLCHWCGRKLTLSKQWVKKGAGNGKPPVHYLTIDHLVALSDGGTNDDSNLVASCPDCNHRRQSTRRKEKKLFNRYTFQFRKADHYYKWSMFFEVSLDFRKGRRAILRIGPWYFAVFDNQNEKERRKRLG